MCIAYVVIIHANILCGLWLVACRTNPRVHPFDVYPASAHMLEEDSHNTPVVQHGAVHILRGSFLPLPLKCVAVFKAEPPACGSIGCWQFKSPPQRGRASLPVGATMSTKASPRTAMRCIIEILRIDLRRNG